MKRLNVYDSVNRERLLGTHPRWAEPHDNYRFAICPRVSCVYDYGPLDYIPTVSYVELQRALSKDGWEVCLITRAPLKDLMCLRDFRLPGENSAARAHRANDSTFY